MLKERFKIFTAYALGISLLSAAAPTGFAEAIEDCIFEIERNYAVVDVDKELSIGFVNAADNEVTWESSNNTVATVSDGVVIPKKPGSTVITAKAGDNCKKCSVTVRESLEDSGIRIVEPYILAANGSTVQLHAEAAPGIDIANATWESSNTKVCTVDENGLVKIVYWEGVAVVTLRAGDYTDEIKVYPKAFACTGTPHFSVSGKNDESQLLQYMYYDRENNTYNLYRETYNNSQWTNVSAGQGYVSGSAIASGEHGDGVIAYAAPKTGQLTITLGQAFANTTTAGLQINHNSERIFPQNDEYQTELAGTNPIPDGIKVNVTAGDYIYIRAVKTNLDTNPTQYQILQAWGNGFQFNYDTEIGDLSITAPKNIYVDIGNSVQINAAASVESSTIRYYSSDESVASVSADGTVTAQAYGMCKIYSVASDSQGTTYAGTATAVNVNSADLLLNKNYAKIVSGGSVKLKAVMRDGDNVTPDTNAVFSSNDENVAIVSSDGTVTAKNAGTAVITVKDGGKAAKCAVEVYDGRLYFEKNYYQINTGETVSLSLNGSLKDRDIVYKQYNSQWTQTTFDESTLIVEAKYNGVVDITATAVDDNGNSVTAICTIIIGDNLGTSNVNYVTYEKIKDITFGKTTAADQYLWKYGNAPKGSHEYTVFEYTNGTLLAGATENNNGETIGYAQWQYGAVTPKADNIRAGFLSDTVLVFRAPKTGTIEISPYDKTNVKLTNNNSDKTKKCSVRMELMHDDKNIYAFDFESVQDSDGNYNGITTFNGTGEGSDSAKRFADDFGTRSIKVNKGDEILFVFRSTGEVSSQLAVLTMENGMFSVKYTDTSEGEEEFTLGSDKLLVSGERLSFEADKKLFSQHSDVASAEENVVTALKPGTAVISSVNSDGTLGDYITLSVDNLAVDTSDKGDSVQISARAGVAEGNRLFAAEYAEDGRLINVKTVLTDAAKPVEISMLSDKSTVVLVKVFLFRSNLSPVCESKTIIIK